MSSRRVYLLIIITLTALTGCGLLQRARVGQHNGIERSDFNLPVFAYPTTDSTHKSLVLMLSGDGGWLEFEDTLCLQFAKAGYNTIGFNSRDYFWERKTPRQTTEDLSELLKIYIDQYTPNKIILCGYSFGADVIPFIYNRLHPHMKRRITALALMSPFATTDFMVHTSDLLSIAKDKRKYLVRTEINHINIPILCFYGQDEEPKAQEDVKKQNFKLNLLPGDHHYADAAYQKIITEINRANQKSQIHSKTDSLKKLLKEKRE